MKRVEQFHGTEQTTHVGQYGAFDHALIIRRVSNQIFDSPRDTAWKTVACLVRGTALPYKFAVSGYNTHVLDGALKRPKWIKRVFQLAQSMNYQIPEHQFDAKRQPGSFYACHTEKQLLAYFLWMHTSLFNIDKLDAPEAIRCSAPPSWSYFPIDIYLCQPGQQKAEVCPDCREFCAQAAEQFDFTITLGGVNRTRCWTLASWPWRFCMRAMSGVEFHENRRDDAHSRLLGAFHPGHPAASGMT